MIRFLLDTSSDYTVEEVKAKGMELVPLHITLGEADYRDAYDLTKDAFYELLTTNEEFPKTSQPTPQDFVDIFEDVQESSIKGIEGETLRNECIGNHNPDK